MGVCTGDAHRPPIIPENYLDPDHDETEDEDPCDDPNINFHKCEELENRGYENRGVEDLLEEEVQTKPVHAPYQDKTIWSWTSSGRQQIRQDILCSRTGFLTEIERCRTVHTTYNPKRKNSKDPVKNTQITIVCCPCCVPNPVTDTWSLPNLDPVYCKVNN